MKTSVRRLSRVLYGVFLSWMVAVPAMTAAVYWNLEWALGEPALRLLPLAPGATFTPGPVTWTVKVLGFAVAAVPAVLTCILLWRLAQLFRGYAQGRIFTADSVRRIRSVGVLLLARELLSPFIGAATSLVLTMNNPPGGHVVTLGLSDSNVTMTVTALTIIVAGHIMEQARELHDEARLTI